LPRHEGGIVNPIERGIRAVDRFQQSRRPLAFTFGVIKKFGDDSAGALAALVAYYGFVSLFPLLLIMITILGMVATPAIEHAVVNSALSQFPVVGNQLNKLRALKAGSLTGLIIGLVGLLWGAQGITQAAQKAMATVWNVPGVIRPGFVPRLGRSAEFVGVLLLDVIITTALAGFSTLGGQAWYLRALAGLITLLVDVGVYLLAFRVLTPKSVQTRDLFPGAALAGMAWAIMQYFGALLVSHQLRHAGQIYGYFGSVLGLVAFLYLAAQISLYAAELNVVRARHLYPRSIVQPPLTEADLRTLTDIAKAEERRPEQRVDVGYPGIDSTISKERADTTAASQDGPVPGPPERSVPGRSEREGPV
jgi:YihY family inner membrane protein